MHMAHMHIWEHVYLCIWHTLMYVAHMHICTHRNFFIRCLRTGMAGRHETGRGAVGKGASVPMMAFRASSLGVGHQRLPTSPEHVCTDKGIASSKAAHRHSWV